MTTVNRRTFMGASACALMAIHIPEAAYAAAPACVSGSLPEFMPNSLTVDCASQRNFQLFKKYTPYLGLAGVVSMTSVTGHLGTYSAGSLMLFPWLKPKGLAVGQRNWGSAFPGNGNQPIAADPIPGASLPVDEYFCRIVLQAPWSMFIGFTVDVPYKPSETTNGWVSNVGKLGDGSTVGIDWTSNNLNQAWFGGSPWIPANNACHGNAWRKVIADGINRASVAAC
ncbi:MAG: hypothetical protein WA268_23355 [Xanthobacteraceae bacterium]